VTGAATVHAVRFVLGMAMILYRFTRKDAQPVR
jgi:hypothetical protein